MTLYITDDTRKITKTYTFNVGVSWANRGEQIKWCLNYLTEDTWVYHDRQGAIYFEYEKDLVWFKLRWR